MRRLLVVAVVGCGSPPVMPAQPVTPKLPDVPAPYVLPPSPDVLAWTFVCEGSQAPTKDVIYDFQTLRLAPIQSGPRIANRSPIGRPRAWPQLEEALQRAEVTLRHCWYWASSRGAPETTLDIAFTMTPLGKTIAHSVVDPSGGSRELVMCLQENLQHLRIDEVSPRTTRMRTRIQFVRADQPAWPKPPKRPSVRAPEPRAACVPVVDDAPVDQLASPVTYTISDFSEDRIPPKKGVPTVRIGCTNGPRPYVGKATIRIAFESNRGAFQACYADARARDPSLAGTLDVTLVFPKMGHATTTVSGPGDAAFHDCIRSAGNQVWLDEAAPDRGITAHFHLELADGDDAIDPEASLVESMQAVNAAKTNRQRCDALANVVGDLARLAPWLDDPRVLAATTDLATFAAKLPADEAKRCLELVERTLREIAFGPVLTTPTHPMHERWSWLDRIEAVLPAAKHLAWGDGLRWFHASTRAMNAATHDQGIAELRTIAMELDKPWGRMASDELGRYELPKLVPTRSCESRR